MWNIDVEGSGDGYSEKISCNINAEGLGANQLEGTSFIMGVLTLEAFYKARTSCRMSSLIIDTH